MSKSELKPRLPRSWPVTVRSAMLHALSLAKYAAVYTDVRVRLQAENNRLLQEVALLREEMRIKDARMACLPPHRRPFYPAPERMAVLEMRAARGWSLEQTAESFLVCRKTIASWVKRLDEQGPEALVQLRTPVNKFPDFVRYAVQRLKTLCPSLGKKKLAEILARAGLHLGTTTVGRMRKEKPAPGPASPKQTTATKRRTVTAKRPNHVWHIDLTVVPTQSGFWCSWLPLALPQCWPFCWWLVLVLDHYSRRVMGFAILRKAPRSVDVRACLERAIASARVTPKYLVSDKGRQFWPCPGYKGWCQNREIRPRFGALGKHGSIAVIERAIRTIKETMQVAIVPTRRTAMQKEMHIRVDWYNQHRPHMTLGGKTPDEVFFNKYPANRRPRIEPRPKWPRASPCARPQVLVAGRPGARFHVELERVDGHIPLPIVRLRRAA